MKDKTLADLKPGQWGIVTGFSDDSLSVKLMEMGCLPGIKITLQNKAPLGDPLGFQVAGYTLALRKKEAATVLIEGGQ